MENTTYFETLKTMQDGGASTDYWNGWASGALGNPAREEQRVSDAYTAGYADGTSNNTTGWKSWVDAK